MDRKNDKDEILDDKKNKIEMSLGQILMNKK